MTEDLEVAHCQKSAWHIRTITDLAAYNEGTLYGTWIDVTERSCDPKLIDDEIQKLLSKFPVPGAEELAIHDHEGFGESIAEYTAISEVCDVVSSWRARRSRPRLLALGDGLSEDRTRIENGYHVVESLAEHAQEYVEDTGLEIPSFIPVDWVATGRELAIDMSEVRMGGRQGRPTSAHKILGNSHRDYASGAASAQSCDADANTIRAKRCNHHR